MKRLALLIMCTIPLTMGCGNYIVRNGEVYNAELDWFQQAGKQTAELSAELVERNCTCDEDGYFEDATCEELADNILTIRARMAWHVAMARYNAGVIDTRPPEKPPEIPPVESMCPSEGED